VFCFKKRKTKVMTVLLGMMMNSFFLGTADKGRRGVCNFTLAKQSILLLADVLISSIYIIAKPVVLLVG
jgi:hypothetical protein